MNVYPTRQSYISWLLMLTPGPPAEHTHAAKSMRRVTERHHASLRDASAWLHDVDLQNGATDQDLLMHKKRHPSKGKRPAWIPRKSSSNFVPSKESPQDREERSHSTPTPGPPRKSTSQWTSTAAPAMVQTQHSTQEMIDYIQRNSQTAFSNRAKLMILSIALCHTCLPEKTGDEDKEIRYQAASPDELALVELRVHS